MDITNDQKQMDQLEAVIEKLKLRLEDIRHQDTLKLSNNFYLHQWLKAGNLNVDKTEILIRNSFKWRKENKIFSQVDDFPMDLAKKFPIYTDAMSKSRRPVGSLNGGCWDLKKYLDDEGKDRFVRYCALLTLEAENVWFGNNTKLLQKNFAHPPKNIIFIVNTLHYSFKQIGPSTTSCVITILHNIANHFPPMVERVVFINVAKVFSIALKIVKPFISFLNLEIHGCDETKWKNALAEFVTSDQLRGEFGGTKRWDDKNNLNNDHYFDQYILNYDTSRSH